MLLFVFLHVVLINPSLFVQVKETDAVVLSGAYVDLHGASEASPENLTKVCQSKVSILSIPLIKLDNGSFSSVNAVDDLDF